MKLVPTRRPSLLSLRRPFARLDEFEEEEEDLSFLPQTTACTMHRRGGMARDAREEHGAVLRPGSRIREPLPHVDEVFGAPGPSARPFVLAPTHDDPTVRVAGLPRLRIRIDLRRKGQAWRVLGPASTRFRMRTLQDEGPPPDPRFHLAGRGGPPVRLGEPGFDEGGEE
ncbi:MAG: hypothetical protein ABIO70_04455 [Pseudomonadota bacterium]